MRKGLWGTQHGDVKRNMMVPSAGCLIELTPLPCSGLRLGHVEGEDVLTTVPVEGMRKGFWGTQNVATRRKHGDVVRKHGDVVRTFLGEPVQASASQGELTRTRASQCEPERAADDGVARGGFFGFH